MPPCRLMKLCSLAARSSDILEGSLWYHFKSKKDLLVEHIKLFQSSFETNIENLKVGDKIKVWNRTEPDKRGEEEDED